MNDTKINKSKVFQIIIGVLMALLLALVTFIVYHKTINSAKLTMGGQFYKQFNDNGEKDADKYFRPSKLPSINDRVFDFSFFNSFYNKKPSEITLKGSLLKTPEDTIINYFSVLRDASNPLEGKGSGCGTLPQLNNNLNTMKYFVEICKGYIYRRN
jgi:hypothetical protein